MGGRSNTAAYPATSNGSTRPASCFRDEACMRGRLRTQLCDLYRHLPRLLPYIRIIVHQLASLSYEHYLHNGMIQEPWSLRWKAISEEGGDMIGRQFVDYGNREYTDVFAFFYAHDDQMAALIDWLGPGGHHFLRLTDFIVVSMELA